MFIKKKVTVKLVKPKDFNKCVYQKNVIVKLFKRKDSIKICLMKKGCCEIFETERFQRNMFIKKKGYFETF